MSHRHLVVTPSSSLRSSSSPLSHCSVSLALPTSACNRVSPDVLLAVCEQGPLISQTDGNLLRSSTAFGSPRHPCRSSGSRAGAPGPCPLPPGARRAASFRPVSGWLVGRFTAVPQPGSTLRTVACVTSIHCFFDLLLAD